jgi:hypothetical protein
VKGERPAHLDRISTGHAARVEDGRRAGRAPRVELEDVIVCSGRGIKICSPVLFVEVGRWRLVGRSGAVIEVGVPGPIPITVRAADGAAL